MAKLISFCLIACSRKRKHTIHCHTLLYYFQKRNKTTIIYKLVKNYPTFMVRKHSNYGSVRIDLLNFTADEYYIKSFLELFFSRTRKIRTEITFTSCLIKFLFLTNKTHKQTKQTKKTQLLFDRANISQMNLDNDSETAWIPSLWWQNCEENGTRHAKRRDGECGREERACGRGRWETRRAKRTRVPL